MRQPSPGPFAYRNYGELATIGRTSAIFSRGRLRATGFPAWLLWSVAHIYYLIGVRNRIIVALDWTFHRGARLISECRRVPETASISSALDEPEE
jgi:NADH:ubiquinone reductase (H+-translocating)